MKKKRIRPSHVVFLIGTLLLCGFLILGSTSNRSADAGIDYGWICDPEEYDCWLTTICEEDDGQRTESYPARDCVFTGNYEEYCFWASWSCWKAYTCPEEELLGTAYMEGLCTDA